MVRARLHRGSWALISINLRRVSLVNNLTLNRGTERVQKTLHEDRASFAGRRRLWDFESCPGVHKCPSPQHRQDARCLLLGLLFDHRGERRIYRDTKESGKTMCMTRLRLGMNSYGTVAVFISVGEGVAHIHSINR